MRSSAVRALPWRVPLGLQLSVLFSLLFIAMFTLLGWLLYVQLDNFLVRDTGERLNRATQPLVNLASSLGRERGDMGRFPRPGSDFQPLPQIPAPRGADAGRISTLLVRELSSPDITVAVLDADGTVITSTTSLDGSEPRILPDLPTGWHESLTANGSARWVLPEAGGGRQLVVMQQAILTAFNNTIQVPFIIEQVASLNAADALLNQLRLYLILGSVFGTILAVAAGLALTRTVLRPLDRMASTAEAISGGDLRRRLRMPFGSNEVARLGHAFDGMVDRLAATLDAQRRFVADASHELRTPLTSLEGLSEMLLIGADRGDPRVVQRTVRSMHGELARLSRLVDDLLTLSRLDSAAPLRIADVELCGLLGEVAAQMSPQAAAHEARITMLCERPQQVSADPDRLRQVLLNLLDNALRYTPAGGEVAMVCTTNPGAGTVRIEVHDQGPGIDPADLPHIFDRFYRGDPSRTRATGSSGLGLAIVRSIVEAHGGRIQAHSAPGQGATFTITLKATESHPKPSPAEKVLSTEH